MSLSTGTRIGLYEIVGGIGAGGMGEVYRARDTKLHRDVAIKVLPELFAADPDRLARFEREARILASLNHPNIATVFGFEEQGPLTALVMELVEGEALDARLRSRGPFTVEETMAIARQLVEALDAAHERGIVHRDLKPGNITLTRDGVVKVLDFGLALDPRLAAGEAATFLSPVTQPGIILGTAAYMSPEQARGTPVDKRADIWAFGCVLYELLTGASPFAGASISDVIARLLEREPDWNAVPASTPPPLVRLLQRCLQKDAKKRLRDIADARAELDEAAGFRAVAAVAAPQRRWLPWVAAAALAAAGFGAAWLAARSADAGPRLSRAVRLTHSAAREFSPAISSDNKWVAYYSEVNGRSDLWVRYVDSGTTLNLTAGHNLDLPVRALIGGLAISPAGDSIAFTSRSRPGSTGIDTWVIPAPLGGTPRKLLSGLQAMQWSPDSRQIAYIRAGSSRGDALFVADSDGMNARQLVPAQGGRHVHWPAWSKDQRWIYFLYSYDTWHTGHSEVFRVALAGGQPEKVIASSRRAAYPAPLPDGSLIYAANPETVDLALWWAPSDAAKPRPLTMGVGEYSEVRASADGSKLVATVTDTLQSSIFRVAVTGGSAQMTRLTDGFSGDLDPTVDAAHDRMVFSSARSGHRNLWLAKTDGTDPRPLTSGPAIDTRPAVSPDGQRVAFISDRGGVRGVWIVDVDGGAPRHLATAVALDTLSWSHDGSRVVYAVPGGDLPRLESVSIADGRVETLPMPTAAVAPAWSPNTDTIAYIDPGPAVIPDGQIGARMIFTVSNSKGQQLHAGLPRQQFSNGYLAWSPDGRRLAAVHVPANDVASVWIIDLTAANPYRKLLDLPMSLSPHGLTWSSDGNSILLSAIDASSDIVLFDVSR